MALEASSLFQPIASNLRASTAISASQTKLVGKKQLSSTIKQLRANGKVALIPYITAGDPSLEMTAQALKLLDSHGADIIELGVPYTDPLADGPVIAAAATRALENGTTLDSVLSMVHDISPSLRAPLVLFSYMNRILGFGIEDFVKKIKAAGVSGLVVPDLPLEESLALRNYAEENGIELVLLASPTTPKDRMREIAESSQGFIYLVSLTGVTGARSSLNAKVEDLIKDLKKVTDKPIAVGFGVSTADHAIQLAKWGADGVIVGSAAVKILAESQNKLQDLGTFISGLRNVL